VLAQLGLSDAADRLVRTYSGGMRRRLDLGASLVGAPRLLLLDEPTTGLDLGHQIRTLELVDELRRTEGLTVLSTMHDLTLAGRFADRFALLSQGRVVSTGTRKDVLDPAVIAEHFGTSVRVIDGDVGWAVVPTSGTS
jgi:iron complex transport system ATP-binding protein